MKKLSFETIPEALGIPADIKVTEIELNPEVISPGTSLYQVTNSKLLNLFVRQETATTICRHGDYFFVYDPKESSDFESVAIEATGISAQERLIARVAVLANREQGRI